MSAGASPHGSPPSERTPPVRTAFHAVPPERESVEPHHAGGRIGLLSLTALGVVYGNIGTSPLYAFKLAISPEYGVSPSAADIFGVLSLLCWALTLIVSVKYVAFMWKLDRSVLRDILLEASLPIKLFLDDAGRSTPPRVPGTAVFRISDLTGAPVVLLHHLKHNKALHLAQAALRLHVAQRTLGHPILLDPAESRR